MRYLPHIEAAIQRLGYIKHEYAAALAVLMEDHEGQHPHQIARLFRQTGSQLPAETKRALGVRSNADMSAEAADALTQRGLASPLKGLDATLLDASFSYFRARNVAAAIENGHDSFRIDGMFSSDCAGCRRLDGQEVTSAFLQHVPPSDCGREACGIGMRLRIDFIGQLVEQAGEQVTQPHQLLGIDGLAVDDVGLHRLGLHRHAGRLPHHGKLRLGELVLPTQFVGEVMHQVAVTACLWRAPVYALEHGRPIGDG